MLAYSNEKLNRIARDNYVILENYCNILEVEGYWQHPAMIIRRTITGFLSIFVQSMLVHMANELKMNDPETRELILTVTGSNPMAVGEDENSLEEIAAEAKRIVMAPPILLQLCSLRDVEKHSSMTGLFFDALLNILFSASYMNHRKDPAVTSYVREYYGRIQVFIQSANMRGACVDEKYIFKKICMGDLESNTELLKQSGEDFGAYRQDAFFICDTEKEKETQDRNAEVVNEEKKTSVSTDENEVSNEVSEIEKISDIEEASGKEDVLESAEAAEKVSEIEEVVETEEVSTIEKGSELDDSMEETENESESVPEEQVGTEEKLSAETAEVISSETMNEADSENLEAENIVEIEASPDGQLRMNLIAVMQEGSMQAEAVMQDESVDPDAAKPEESQQPEEPEKPQIPQKTAEEITQEAVESFKALKLEKRIRKLEELVGLEGVKQEIHSLVNLIRVRKMREKHHLPSMPMSYHMVFTGSPGTGKTTVARLIGEIYKELGILSHGTLVETDRAGLVAGYVGQTALKVKEVVDKTKGGILFIDEAYTLSNQQGGNDFGTEAIDTLVKLMEDYRDDLVVIVAGYTREMEEFLRSNTGLISRFNKFIDFKDYSNEELIMILKSMAGKSGFRIQEDAIVLLENYLEAMSDEERKDFGNARGIRNLFEKMVAAQANRVIAYSNPSVDDLSLIVAEDCSFIGNNKKED